MEIERIEDEKATTQFIAAVARGKENDVIVQISQYFKTLGIELTKNQTPRISGGQIKLRTTQEHAKHLATWLEDPRVQGRKQDEMYIVENENQLLGGSQFGSRINYSEPAIDKNGKVIPSVLIHPEEVADLTLKLIKQFQNDFKKSKAEKGADNTAEFESFLEKQLYTINYSPWTDTKKTVDDLRYKSALYQAVIRNIKIKKDNEIEKPLLAAPYKRKAIAGNLKMKDTQINIQGAEAEK